LGLGVGFEAGRFAGMRVTNRGVESVDSFSTLIGGLPRMNCVPSETAAPIQAEWDQAFEREETIAVLGRKAWSRLRDLRVALIGAGRLGSAIAALLAGGGPGGLTLIDPGRRGSQDAGLATSSTRANSRRRYELKVEQLKRNLKAGFGISVTTVPSSCASLAALQAIKSDDLIVSSTDDPAARLAAALIAKLYLIPLVDVSTTLALGVGYGTSEVSGLEGSVRLVLPEKCLLCTGGLPGIASMYLEERTAVEPGRAFERSPRRRGRLRSLDTLTASLAVRLIEDLVAGRVGDPGVQLRIAYSRKGVPSVSTSAARLSGRCEICEMLTGRGDAGLRAVPETLARMQAPSPSELYGIETSRMA
jgi:hypothetical protein